MTLSAADRKEAEVLTVALVLVVAGLLSYSLWASMGYNDPKFKAYIQGRQYCDAFYGGNNIGALECMP